MYAFNIMNFSKIYTNTRYKRFLFVRRQEQNKHLKPANWHDNQIYLNDNMTSNIKIFNNKKEKKLFKT